MRGIFIVILCLCSSVELFAAKVKNRKTGDTFPVKITASWENGNGVRKLYDTPLGAVYSFHLSAPVLENKFGFWGNLPKPGAGAAPERSPGAGGGCGCMLSVADQAFQK